jgi:hypothetical protein
VGQQTHNLLGLAHQCRPLPRLSAPSVHTMPRSSHATSIDLDGGSAHFVLAERRALFARSQTGTVAEFRSMACRTGQGLVGRCPAHQPRHVAVYRVVLSLGAKKIWAWLSNLGGALLLVDELLHPTAASGPDERRTVAAELVDFAVDLGARAQSLACPVISVVPPGHSALREP